jgi:hypothetical protein
VVTHGEAHSTSISESPCQSSRTGAHAQQRFAVHDRDERLHRVDWQAKRETMDFVPDDRSRYGRAQLNPFQRQLEESADKHAFTFQPWKEGTRRLTDEQLTAHVESEISAHGVWTDYAELTMGGGMVARIELVEIDGAPVFRTTGGDVVKIQADYLSLDRALDMVALFSRLAWDIMVATSWRDSDLVVPDE